MINPNRALPFDYCIWSTHPNVDCAVEHLKKDIMATGRINRWHQRYTDHLKLILLNLYNAYTHAPEMSVSYHRAKDRFKSSRYRPITVLRDSFIIIVETLGIKHLKYIDDSYLGSQKSHRISRMQSQPKLIDLLLTKYSFDTSMIERNDLEEVIILRDIPKITYPVGKNGKKYKKKEKKDLEYTDTPDTLRMRENLRKFNQFLKNHFIGLCVNDEWLDEICMVREHGDKYVNFKKTSLRRIFSNADFGQGGRFYGGWWQSLPGHHEKYGNSRRWIRIDNMITEELDFSGYIIRMLYAEQGLPIPSDDVYLVPGIPKEARDFLKIVLLTIVGSKSRGQASSSIDKTYKEMYEEPIENFPPEKIVEAFLNKHADIANSFYKGRATFMQNADSHIAEDVMLDLMGKGIPSLCIHDSFIVRRDHLDALRKAMDKAILNHYGVVFKTKADPTAYETDFLWPNGFYPGEELTVEQFEKLSDSREICTKYFARLADWERRYGLCPK